jgi:1-acyl-sn-glycerol-3-phosphate acyltransferase
MATVRQWLGSIAFVGYLVVSVPVYALLVTLTVPFSYRVTYRWVIAWVNSVMRALRVLCRLDYTVEGREHIPAAPAVVLMKHSSAWETIAQIQMFPQQTWVLKRELLWIPIFGWALRLLKPIAIDRKGGGAAVQQVLEQGKQRLDEGFWVVIFPEGTRVPVGQTRRYGLSGALLATAAQRPVVPVAHDAGYFWPRHGFLKRPGTIRVVIGPAIATAGCEPREINERVQRWIETEVARLDSAHPRPAKASR